MAQENLIKASKIPFTIVRATQFFDFVGGIAQFSTEGATVRLPSALVQPIAADDVAAALADVAIAEPLNDTVAAFLYIPPLLRGAAVGLLALLRIEAASVGTSVA
jgi:uncharacterized protein YbjT (DUF2867 family)